MEDMDVSLYTNIESLWNAVRGARRVVRPEGKDVPITQEKLKKTLAGRKTTYVYDLDSHDWAIKIQKHEVGI